MISFISENWGLDGVDVFLLVEARFRIIENKESALDNFCNLLPPPAREFAPSFVLLCCTPATQDPFVVDGLSAERGLNISTVEL